jgi:hypothetical protein
VTGFSPGLAAYKIQFQLAPLVLTGSIAANIPGAMFPIVSLTEALNFTIGIIGGSENIEVDNFFANYEPLPDATLIENQIGTYPFANQQVAADRHH